MLMTAAVVQGDPLKVPSYAARGFLNFCLSRFVRDREGYND